VLSSRLNKFGVAAGSVGLPQPPDWMESSEGVILPPLPHLPGFEVDVLQ
jgi:hypothetical protein